MDLMAKDWSATELNIINDGILKRWKSYKPELNFADVELKVLPNDKELTAFPAAVWRKNDCYFVVIKIDSNTYKNIFYYENSKQFGTGIEKYNDLYTCVITLLQVQADHINS